MIEELNLEKAIDFAVETEKLGLHFYGRLSKRFKDDNELHELFATLARDEQKHAERFEALRSKATPGGDMQFEQKQYLKALSLSEVFVKAGIGKNTDEIEDKQDVLQRAFNLEQTSLLFYEALKPMIRIEEEGVLDEIIAEEKKHVIKIMEYMITDAKVRGLDDKF